MANQTKDKSDTQVVAYSRIGAQIPRYVMTALAYSRPLAYASEVGESMRKVMPRMVTPLYALSIGYVGLDIVIKRMSTKGKPSDYRKYYTLDLSLWHLGASILFPAITINRFVHGLTWVFNKANVSNKVAVFGPAIAAICLIPFIVHPLDHATDHIMDHTFRKFINFHSYDNVSQIESKKDH